MGEKNILQDERPRENTGGPKIRGFTHARKKLATEEAPFGEVQEFRGPSRVFRVKKRRENHLSQDGQGVWPKGRGKKSTRSEADPVATRGVRGGGEVDEELEAVLPATRRRNLEA